VYQKTFDENNPPECPNSHPEQHIFYGTYADTRACTACACSKPIGSDCVANALSYGTSTCDPNSAIFGGAVGLTNQLCLAFGVTGDDLMGMTAKWWINEPGTCQPSGGELVGEVKPVDPTIFCCLPLSSP